jgi:hypothetical protein
MMYSFAQRPDTRVYDEPLYGYYLKHYEHRENHPGADEVMDSMECNGQKVVEMMLGNDEKPVLFFKNMAHHLQGLDFSFLSDLSNVLLTRHPEEMLPSYAAVIESPGIDDVGYRMHLEIAKHLKSKQLPVIVLDAKSVLLNPESQLKKLCAALNIPYYAEMLSWPAGARPEDGSWARYWYANVHRSTGFIPYQPKATAFPEHLKPLLEECMPYYEELLEMASQTE